MKYQYPKQVGAVKRTKKVFSVDAELYNPQENEHLSPLVIFSGYSRFILNIIDKEQGDNVVLTANIPSGQIAYIKKKTEIAMTKRATSENNSTHATTSNTAKPVSLAYTQQLKDNTFRNMTPAEVLLQNPANKEKLLSVKKWLEENLARYKGNQAQIDAINDAISLFDKGELNKTSTEQNVSLNNTLFDVYHVDYKFKSTTNEKGYHLIYGISIIYDTNPEKKYPVAINITNLYAPVETSPNGQKSVAIQKAENKTKSSMLLTEEEWYSLINHIETVNNGFAQMTFQKQFNEAIENSWHGNSTN